MSAYLVVANRRTPQLAFSCLLVDARRGILQRGESSPIFNPALNSKFPTIRIRTLEV
jgi:hypothetical protein